jgi:hypothetical protein
MNNDENENKNKNKFNILYLILSIIFAIVLSVFVIYIINSKFSNVPLSDQYKSLVGVNKPNKSRIN